MRLPTLVIFLGLCAVAGQAAADAPLELLFQDDFDKGADRWQPTDVKAWQVVKTDKGCHYRQHKNSNYKPPHRSPLNISLIKDLSVGDFVFEARLQSTGKDGGHRDMCLFWGYQDPAHFYYVHLGKKADAHANQIFIVNGAPRTKITTKTTDGTPWDDQWHQLKIVRKVGDGTIEVYFDDMKTPAMVANDKNFTWGQVGIGSFDDSGNWDDVKLRGVRVGKDKK